MTGPGAFPNGLSPIHRLRAALPALAPDGSGAAALERWLDARARGQDGGPITVVATTRFLRVRLEGGAAWVEIGPDGVREGRLASESVAIDRAVLEGPEHAVGAPLLGWAVDHGVDACRLVREGAVGDDAWRELRVPLPVWPADRTLAAVRDAFGRLGARWLGDPVSLAMTVGSCGTAELVAAWSSGGVSRLGVGFLEPPLDLYLRLARALPLATDSRVEDLEDALGEEPTAIACLRRGAEVELERTWALSA